MGFLSKMFAVARSTAGLPPRDPALAAIFGYGDTKAGMDVNEWTALNISAVWAAVSFYYWMLGSLPIILYRRQGENGKDRYQQHPAYRLVHDQPNEEMSAQVWQGTMQAHTLIWGNSYSEIVRNGHGRPRELKLITPDRVTPDRDTYGIFYRIGGRGGEAGYQVRSEDMIHIPGLGFDGLVGYSVVRMARESWGLNAATERFGATAMGSGTEPGVYFKTARKLEKKVKDEVVESWERRHQGPNNAHRTAFIDGGLEIGTLDRMPPEDFQYLQTREFQNTEVARWFNLPPHVLRDLTRSTNNNIEQQSIDVVIYSLWPWGVRWEQELGRKLLLEEERDELYFEHLFEALLRGDTETRYKVYQLARQNGLMNADEIRSRENMNPIEGGSGKVYLVNSAMVPVDRLVNPPAPVQPAAAATAKPIGASAAGRMPAQVIELRDIRQEDNYSCGACCGMTVGKKFNVGPDTLEEWKVKLNTTPETSTRPMALVEYLSELGLVVTAAGDLDIDDLREFWRQGKPVICPIQEYGLPSKQASFDFGHYVVVIGAALGYVFVFDPSIDNVLEGQDADQSPGTMMITEADFLEVWHDRDVDGKRYNRFGIGVGAELLGDAAGMDGDETADVASNAKGSPSPGGTQPGKETPPAKATGQSLPATADLTSQQRAGLIAAQRAVLLDAVTRLTRKETAAARRASKRPADFLAWLDAFYSKYQTDLAQAITPAIRGHLALVDRGDQAEQMVHGVSQSWTATSKQTLLELAGRATPANLEAQIGALCDRWEIERPIALADVIMQEEISHATI